MTGGSCDDLTLVPAAGQASATPQAPWSFPAGPARRDEPSAHVWACRTRHASGAQNRFDLHRCVDRFASHVVDICPLTSDGLAHDPAALLLEPP